MPTTLEDVRPIRLAEILQARERIAHTIVRTPLVRLELGPGYPDIRLKLENLQPINAYKLRGAANAVAMLPEAERNRGVWTISAGNAGQGVAYAARKAGVPCSVVVIETAPASKLERMKALGAKLIPVPYDVAWKALEERAFQGVEGTFVHPFDDHNFIAGPAPFGIADAVSDRQRAVCSPSKWRGLMRLGHSVFSFLVAGALLGAPSYAADARKDVVRHGQHARHLKDLLRPQDGDGAGILLAPSACGGSCVPHGSIIEWIRAQMNGLLGGSSSTAA